MNEKHDPPAGIPAADKLTASGLSTPVIDSRGYEILPRATTESDARRILKTHGMDGRSLQGKRLRRSLLDGDILLMPWFMIGDPATPVATQFRPQYPGVDTNGRSIKYEFPAGMKTPLGQHPAMPVSWLADPSIPVMLVEGMLKADSAMSALLAQWKVESLDALPHEARVAIISFAGVGNWGDNPEWATVALRDRDVWVAFDADTATNLNVHAMAVRLWEFLSARAARPRLVSLASITSEKGVDDYLGSGGTWAALLATLVDTLPNAPTPADGDGGHVGYRIGADGTCLEKWVESRDMTGNLTSAGWRDSWPIMGGGSASLPLGGRVVSLETTRPPSDDEARTGVFQPPRLDDDEDASSTATVEVSWRDADATVRTAMITGDSRMLGVPVEKWGTQHNLNVSVPDEVLRLPCWPLSGPTSVGWLRAVKAHRSDETLTRTRWTRDGWVPQDQRGANAMPVFTIGSQVVGGDGGTTLSGTRKLLQRWSSYGLGDSDHQDWADDGYRAHVQADLRTVMEVFSLAFTSPGTFAAIICAALRAIVPLRPKTSYYVVGPSGGGKTFVASALMGFYSAYPGAFRKDALPGSAQDSVAFTESVLTSAVVHVADDLAPSSSGRQAEQERLNIETMLRNVFNGTGRGRANMDGTPRRARVPYAVLIATAENELFVESVKNRALAISMERGALPPGREPTDALDDLCNADGAPARVTRAAVVMLRHLATTGFTMPTDDHGMRTVKPGWAAMVEFFATRRDQWKKVATDLLNMKGFRPSETTRSADMLADVLVSADVLYLLLRESGCDPRHWVMGNPDAWRRTNGNVSAPPDGPRDDHPHEWVIRLCNAIAREIVRDQLPQQAERARMTPGRAFLAAVEALLESGHCHLLSAGNTGSAPGILDSDSTRYGWSPDGAGGFRPRGASIGYWGRTPNGGEIVCLLVRPSFAAARKEYPELVPPGSNQSQTSAAVRSEGLIAPGVVLEGEWGSGRITLNGGSVRGIIVSVDALHGHVPDADPDGGVA